MRASLSRPSVCMQAIIHLMKQFGYHPVTGFVSHFLHFFSSSASLRTLLDVQRNGDSGSPLVTSSISPSKSLRSVLSRSIARFRPPPTLRTRTLEVFEALIDISRSRSCCDGWPRNPGRLRYQRDASMPKNHCFGRRVKSKLSLVQQWSQKLESFCDQPFLHARSISWYLNSANCFLSKAITICNY